MRISLLLEREPFGSILEQTLTNYWSAMYNQPHHVQWQMNQVGHCPKDKSKEWLANIYLNAIFTPALAPQAFDPIRREFAHSTVWWKRPWQRSYVAMATNKLTAKAFAQARLYVSPTTPDATSTLIVAGNHKVRLLNHHKRSVTNLLKIGFGNHFMRRELAVRQIASKCGVPMPTLYEINEADGWYTEAYMSGTPTNRLVDQREAARAMQIAIQALQVLYKATQEHEPLSAYLSKLLDALRKQIETHHSLPEAAKAKLHSICRALATQVQREKADDDPIIVTVLTHGDFQPANILVNAEGVWLIDWEYTARRQSGYDCFVYGMSARAPYGLAARLQHFVTEGWPAKLGNDNWPTLGTSRQIRQCHSALFLLEDLLLQLEENNQAPLTKIGSGLVYLQQEIDMWLTDN